MRKDIIYLQPVIKYVNEVLVGGGQEGPEGVQVGTHLIELLKS